MDRRASNRRRAASIGPLACIVGLLIAVGGCASAGSGSSAGEGAGTSGESRGDVALTLLGTTDVHGHLLPVDYYTGEATDYGLALLAPLVDSVRAANPKGSTYLFDSGDLLQGTPLAYVYARLESGTPNPIIRAMNELGYDASAVGNHEYDYGVEHLQRAVAAADFPFVSASVFENGTDRHAFRPYVLIPHVVASGDTILIGVTGNTPPGVANWDRATVEGHYDFRDVVESVAPETVGATDADRTAAPAARLRVIATTDFHGHLLPDTYRWSHGRPVGGAAAISAYVARERARADSAGVPTIVVDAGDLMQGTPISNLTDGRATVAVYDAAGYDAAAIGNHEFDWGAEMLQERMAQARFPWLAANVFVAGTDTAPSYVRPAVLLERGGVRVGIVGLAAEETPTTTRPSNVAGLAFRDGAATLDAWIPRLRARGADFVVVLAHAGAFCDSTREGLSADTARLETGCAGEVIEWARDARAKPDLIVAGHTHVPIETRVDGVPIVEAAAYGERYDVVDLSRGDGAASARIRSMTPWTDSIAPDTAVAALVARYRAEIGPKVDRVVADLADSLPNAEGESALGDLLADAQRSATGARAAIMNNGGIRAPLDAGAVRWRELYELQPFGNRLVVLELSGAELRQAIEHGLVHGTPSVHVSGIHVRYDPQRPAGQRVLTLRLDGGGEVRDARVYPVAVNDFMADGGSGFTMLQRAATRRETGIVDLDALIDYLSTQPQPVRAPEGGRMIAATRTTPEDR